MHFFFDQKQPKKKSTKKFAKGYLLHTIPPLMAKEEKIQAQGKILELLPNGDYRLQLISMADNDLEDEGMIIFGYPSGKMRRFRISLLPGDIVDVELTPYDLTRGRMTRRHNVPPSHKPAATSSLPPRESSSQDDTSSPQEAA